MKRIMTLTLTFLFVFSLCACEKQKEETPIELDLDTSAAALTASGYFPDTLEALDPASVPQNENEFTPSQNDASKPESETTSDFAVNENEALLPADIEAAQQAALDYYKGTVFEIQSIYQIDLRNGWEGEVMFRVSCTKGGEPQVDRSISLSCQNGSWIVVGEGY